MADLYKLAQAHKLNDPTMDHFYINKNNKKGGIKNGKKNCRGI